MGTDLPLELNLVEGTGATSGPSRYVKLREDTPLVVNLAKPSFAIEQYQNIAVQLEGHIERAGRRHFSLMVTSPEQGSGKTLTSLNLALILCRGGERRVLLVEGDFLRPRLASFLRPEPAADRGFYQVLENILPLRDAVLSVVRVGLDVMMAGTAGDDREVLSARKLSPALTEMSRHYEIVIIDSPPLPVVANARVIAQCADGVLLVARAGASRHRNLEAVLTAVGPEKVVGLVLNGARISRPRYY